MTNPPNSVKMTITKWSCVNPEKFPCDAPQGCGGAFCWKAFGFDKEPETPTEFVWPREHEPK